jgi:hypothetical protein
MGSYGFTRKGDIACWSLFVQIIVFIFLFFKLGLDLIWQEKKKTLFFLG